MSGDKGFSVQDIGLDIELLEKYLYQDVLRCGFVNI